MSLTGLLPILTVLLLILVAVALVHAGRRRGPDRDQDERASALAEHGLSVTDGDGVKDEDDRW